MKSDQLTSDLAMIARNAIDYIIKLERERDALLKALKDTTAHLVAAVSLLERGSKKAAASDRMFERAHGIGVKE